MVNATIESFMRLSMEEIEGQWPEERRSKWAWPNPLRLNFFEDRIIRQTIVRISENAETLVTSHIFL
jgi:hypothetical protein